MNRELSNMVEYIVAVISEFAAKHNISTKQSYNYLAKYKGMLFLEKFYNVNHTLSFNDMVDDLTLLCKNNGGNLQ
jgi:hypothetical protein